jgi:3-oxoacyl-[acyl-carrier-protein] synthase-3
MKKSFVSIEGIGAYTPNNIITNKYLANLYNVNENWPETYLGIKERRWVIDESVSDLGYKAALEAIKNSNILKNEIDLLIVSTSSSDKMAPSNACIIAEKLEINCPCFDINSVCTGFLYGLNIATSFIESNTYKKILLIASETYSKITDTSNRDCVYFGDGAGAIILTKSNNGWISTEVYSDGKGKDGFVTPTGSTFIMNGKDVFDAGITKLPLAIKKLLENTNTPIESIKKVIPHQPGIKMLKEIADRVGIPFYKFETIMDKYANIASASIPIALDNYVKSNKIENGDLIMLASIGSGWTWGVSLINWQK